MFSDLKCLITLRRVELSPGGLPATRNNWMVMMMISEPEPNSLKAEATRFSVEKSRDKVDKKDRTARKNIFAKVFLWVNPFTFTLDTKDKK